MSNVAYKTGVDVVSTTLADIGANLIPGHVRWESGKEYMLCLSGGTIPDGFSCCPDISLTAAASALVVTITPADDETWAINNTGGSIATDTYFWGLCKGVGYGYADTASTLTGGIAVGVDGTSGELMELTSSGLMCGVALATIAVDTLGSIYFDCTKHNFAMQA